ncbi:MAG: hypothetical protein MUD08_10360 [Cytophagales bacterium]|jgi:hypothetical protein|nr:hypothetical protein [Cytophagales bacterium]
MRKTLFFTAFLLQTVFLFTSCVVEPSESVDQDRIFTAYELFYDKNENKTYAKATFRFGNVAGTLLQLGGTSEVKFNNDVLDYQSLGFYEKVYPGLVTSGTFTFKDAKGTVYTNVAPAMRAIDFPNTNLSVPRNASFTLNFAGDPLAAGENVGVLIGTELFLQINANTSSVNLSSNQLAKLNPGPYTAVMDRYRIADISQKASAGGVMTVKYRTGNKSIQITN